MAFDQQGIALTGLVAAGDLSTKQYLFVKLSAAGTVTSCSAITDVPIGVLQNAPSAAGRAAEVWISGISKVVAGGNIAAGDLIGTTNAGKAVKLVVGTDTTAYARGIALAAGAANDLIPVVLLPIGRAA